MADRGIIYRLCATLDPEERLEDAAMWKALHDEFGDEIQAATEDSVIGDDAIVFGRSRRFSSLNANPVDPHLPYWTDPTFLAHCNRSFKVMPIEDASAEVNRLHVLGKNAFVKSTKMKHAIFRVPVGVDLRDEMGVMALSFIDGGPELMVQEHVDFTFEHRFFCVDREVVTYSPTQWQLTPASRLHDGEMFRTPSSSDVVLDLHRSRTLWRLAVEVAKSMRVPHAAVDCGMIGDTPALVEFNPLRLGECGLYACDVAALAKAARKLLPHSSGPADPAGVSSTRPSRIGGGL